MKPPVKYSWLLLLVPILFLTGCGGAGMYEQPKYGPLAASNFFPDGRSARPIPAGAIPQGQVTAGNPVLSGMDSSGNPVKDIPVPVTPELVQQGQERFTIYCAPCHGAQGDGKGIIVQFGMPAPPSFHTPDLTQAPAGKFFDVITNGFGKMFSYAYRVKPEERWAIIAYIRALQLGLNVKPDNLTPDQLKQIGTTP